MSVRLIKEVAGKIMVCDTNCTYDLKTCKGQHSWGCRYGTLAELEVATSSEGR